MFFFEEQMFISSQDAEARSGTITAKLSFDWMDDLSCRYSRKCLLLMPLPLDEVGEWEQDINLRNMLQMCDTFSIQCTSNVRVEIDGATCQLLLLLMFWNNAVWVSDRSMIDLKLRCLYRLFDLWLIWWFKTSPWWKWLKT